MFIERTFRRREDISYFKIDDQFYVEVVRSYEDSNVCEMWFCRKNYGIKYFMLGLLKPCVGVNGITKADVLCELGLGQWSDKGKTLGFYVNELLDEGEEVDVLGFHFCKMN